MEKLLTVRENLCPVPRWVPKAVPVEGLCAVAWEEERDLEVFCGELRCGRNHRSRDLRWWLSAGGAWEGVRGAHGVLKLRWPCLQQRMAECASSESPWRDSTQRSTGKGGRKGKEFVPSLL